MRRQVCTRVSLLAVMRVSQFAPQACSQLYCLPPRGTTDWVESMHLQMMMGTVPVGRPKAHRSSTDVSNG